MQKTDLDSKIVHVVDEVTKPQDNTIELSTGVILRGKQAPPMTLITIMGAFPRPKPPVVMIKNMGREMENPDDPDYIKRVKAWESEQGNAVFAALILCGTELVSKPEEMPGPDDQAWMDEYEIFDLPMRKDNPSWRYLRWVQHKAAVTAEDIKQITAVVGRLSGIPEKAVESAEGFPGGDKKDR